MLRQLALDPLVTIEADPDAERGIRAELNEARSPVTVEDIEIVVIDADLAPVEVETDDGAIWALLFFGAEGGNVFLGHADENNTFFTTTPAELGKTALGDFVLAFTSFELDYRDSMLVGKAQDGVNKGLGHLAQQCGGGQMVPPMAGEKPGELIWPL